MPRRVIAVYGDRMMDVQLPDGTVERVRIAQQPDCSFQHDVPLTWWDRARLLFGGHVRSIVTVSFELTGDIKEVLTITQVWR